MRMQAIPFVMIFVGFVSCFACHDIRRVSQPLFQVYQTIEGFGNNVLVTLHMFVTQLQQSSHLVWLRTHIFLYLTHTHC